MNDKLTLTIDGRQIEARPGQSILEAADGAGVYIPRLCFMESLSPAGSCRVCTVRANGRAHAACTQPVSEGMVVENDTAEFFRLRRNLIDMLFVEGNHFCMSCEKSGECELQALAYRFGITAPKYPFMFPQRDVDATHPDLLLDRNRCVLCGRCVRASRELDGKHVLGFTGRGAKKRLTPDAVEGLRGTAARHDDRAAAACPTGALLVKRKGFSVPVGLRRFDREPIGSDVERSAGGE
jgi:[NiFe] hydrogenase diaphorase moiety small subunit